MRRGASPALPFLLALLLPVAPAGCGDGGSGAGWSGVVDTLPSGVVHVRNPRDGRWDVGEAWSAAADLRIGSTASGGPDQFGWIADVEVDDRGRLYVLDQTAREVRVFDPEGTWVRSFGSRGPGPGELENPKALDRGPEGRLWVSDSGNWRFQLYDTAGAAVGTHPFGPQTYSYGERWGPDGLLHTFVAERGRAFVLRLVRRRLEGEELVPVDTLPVPMTWRGDVVPVTFRRNERVFTAMVPVPFQATAERLLLPGEGWWLSHPGERYRLARLDFAGDTLLLAERLYDAVEVTEDDVRRALGRLGGIEELGGGPRIDPDRIPERHPPVDGLAALPDGHLLVRRHVGEGRQAYDVFAPDGIFLGSIRWDGLERFTLQTATDEALYGVRRDELDVPRVVRVRLGR